MTEKRVVVASIGVALVLAASPSMGRDPQWWGLGAVAVSPDGKTVMTGGQNRVLYVLDGQTLKVTRRIWFETRLGWASYNKDGSVLVVEDEREYLHFLNAETLKEISVLPDCYVHTHHRSADLLATVKFDRKERKKPPYIRLLSLSDGSEKGRIELRKGAGSRYMTFTPDAKRLLVLASRKDAAEKTVKRSDIPKDIKGQARLEFEQRHDGYTSELLTFEVPSGKLLKTAKTWYACRRGRLTLAIDGDDVLVFQETNINARIGPDGKTTLFRTGLAGECRGVSENHKTAVVASWRRVAHIAIDGMKETRIAPECGIIVGITFGPDGSAWLATSGYRLVRVSRDGKLKSTTPVY